MGTRTKIDWCDATWNPVVGCSGGCWYCYAKRIARRFAGRPGWPADFTKPEFFPQRLEIPKRWKSPKRILVCSMADLFAPDVPDSWRRAIAEVCADCPQHRFLLLSKSTRAYTRMNNPEAALPDYLFGDNCWFGISVTLPDTLPKAFYLFETCPDRQRFVSLEPLLGDVTSFADDQHWPGYSFGSLLNGHDEGRPIYWLIIGALTGPGARQPEREWVEKILRAADENKVPVWMKDNLIWPEAERRRELPEGLRLPVDR